MFLRINASHLRKAGLGCIGLIASVTLVLGIVLSLARGQVSHEAIRVDEVVQSLPADANAIEDALRPTLIQLYGSWATLIVTRGEPGHPLKATVTHDPQYHRFEQSGPVTDAGQRVANFSLKRIGSEAFAALRPIVGGRIPVLNVTLPPDRPYALHIRLTGGSADLNLGGLWLTEVDVRTEKSLTRVMFREETREPLERLNLDNRAGRLVLRSAGNASPRNLDVHQGMGTALFDLTGAWRTDSAVSNSVAFGFARVQLPGGVTLNWLGNEFGSMNTPTDEEIQRPTLDLELHFDIGDMRVIPAPDIKGESGQ